MKSPYLNKFINPSYDADGELVFIFLFEFEKKKEIILSIQTYSFYYCL